MKGFVNTPGATNAELQTVAGIANSAKTTAENAASSAAAAAAAAAAAKEAAEKALEEITSMTSVINAVPSQSGALTYNGQAQTPSWNNYDPTALELGGVTSGTDAGSYIATFTPKEGYKWADETTEAKQVTWTIGRATVSLPTQSGSLTYSGSQQSPSWSGYDTSKMTLGGTTTGTNAGSYNASFTPKDNYQWPDGATTAKTVSWSIAKAAGSLSLSPQSLSLNESDLTGEVTVTRAGDGQITAQSNNTGVATVSVSGNKIVVTGKANGNATVTVNVGAGTNHNAPSSKTFSVAVSILAAKTTATGGVSYTNGLSGISQEDLTRYARAISNNSAITNATSTVYIDDGSKHYKLSVGDTVSISVSGANYSFRIMGFNHDTLSTSTAYGAATATGKAGISFQMVDCLNQTYQMNSSNTNSGGWNGCALRSTLQGTIKNSMPQAWRNIIKKVSKKSGTGGGSSSGTQTTSDDLFLLSEIEIFGSRNYSVSGEGEQYAYYKAGNSRVKKVNGSAGWWWERSPYSGDSYTFCAVSGSGNAGYGYAGSSSGVAFGFCV